MEQQQHGRCYQNDEKQQDPLAGQVHGVLQHKVQQGRMGLTKVHRTSAKARIQSRAPSRSAKALLPRIDAGAPTVSPGNAMEAQEKRNSLVRRSLMVSRSLAA